MTFTEKDKLKAMAIVHVFETSRPFGDYAACVVLNDGAGVSYGINQFTHRSGSLRLVVEKYLAAGASVGRNIIAAALPLLRRKSVPAINTLAGDVSFKKALRAAAVTREMKDAQEAVAFDRYLRPALDVCRAKGFVMPLSLAVVYDSVTHGSWELISARVTPLGVKAAASKDATLSEKAWITEYVRRRHLWLTNLARLRATNYRTKFFLDQFAIGNWQLRLPITCHGSKLTDEMFAHRVSKSEPSTQTFPEPSAPTTPAIGQTTSDASTPAGEAERESVAQDSSSLTEAPPSPNHVGVSRRDAADGKATGTSIFVSAGEAVATAAGRFDRIDGAVTAITKRKDAAKSLWATVVGTIWQAAWAVFALLIGMPRIVWIVVAVIAAVLAIIFLYRQIALGKIREMSEPPASAGG